MTSEDRRRHRRGRALRLIGFAAAVVGLSVGLTSGLGVAASAEAPDNTSEPTISGSPSVGSTLTATAGTWSPSPQTITYQWVRCSSSGGAEDGSDCATISGATTSAYIVSSGDVGSRMRVRVTATIGGDSATAASNPTELIGAAPVRVGDPVVSGSPVVGQRLSTNQGSWANNPTSFAYQWVRCPTSGGNPDGSNCAAIGGATSSQYEVRSSDAGLRLRVRVTASNSSGSAVSASNATAVVSNSSSSGAPRNTAEPKISGSAHVGAKLTTSQGSWANSPSRYAYQWYSCPTSGGKPDASDCAAIGGATSTSYTVASNVVNRRLRTRVTASNSRGSSTSTSNPTSVVQSAAPPAPTGCPAGTGAIPINQLSAPARLLVDGQSIVPSPIRKSTLTLTMRFRVSACGGRPVVGALVYATGVPYNQFSIPKEQPTGGDGWAQMTMSRLRGFPASQKQQLLVVFVRARKGGENLLGGISTRRLVSFRVNLRR